MLKEASISRLFYFLFGVRSLSVCGRLEEKKSDLLLRVDLDLAFVLLELGRHQSQLALEARHVLAQLECLVLFLRQSTRQVRHLVATSLVLLLLVVQPAPRHKVGGVAQWLAAFVA